MFDSFRVAIRRSGDYYRPVIPSGSTPARPAKPEPLSILMLKALKVQSNLGKKLSFCCCMEHDAPRLAQGILPATFKITSGDLSVERLLIHPGTFEADAESIKGP